MIKEVQCSSPSIWPLTSTKPSAVTLPTIFNPLAITVPRCFVPNMATSLCKNCGATRHDMGGRRRQLDDPPQLPRLVVGGLPNVCNKLVVIGSAPLAEYEPTALNLFSARLTTMSPPFTSTTKDLDRSPCCFFRFSAKASAPNLC